MADDSLRAFFLAPACPCQRQYEALRAVFVEGLSQKDVAARFGYTYDSLRQLVCHFRAACAAGATPPFSTAKAQDGPSAPKTPPRPSRRRTSRRSPTPNS
jgi:hypothetical protein